MTDKEASNDNLANMDPDQIFDFKKLAQLCIKTDYTIEDLVKSFSQVINFHKEQQKKYSDAGDPGGIAATKHEKALEALEQLINSMVETQESNKKILAQIQAILPNLTQTSGMRAGMSNGSQRSEDDTDIDS
ncbi:MAG: hypothetical protein WCW01_03490 [Gammaproteobacteria bacterium]